MFEDIKPMKLDSSKQGIYFTSDLHFNHQNILKFCKRPWNTTEEMDEALIKNWNSVVGENDIVFNLGDFAFAPNWRWKEILSQLKGKHYLVLGNHDVSRWPGDKIMELFAGVYQQLSLKVDDRLIYLNHYPYLCFGGAYRGPQSAVWQLFGHVHSGPDSFGKDSDRLDYRFPYQYDVGVDNNNYTPISWQQVQEKIASQVECGIIAKSKEEHSIPDEAYNS